MRLRDVESEIASAETTAELWEALRRYFHDTDVRKLMYMHLPPLGAVDSLSPDIRAEGFSEAFKEQYLERRLYRDNPVFARAQRQVEPIYWDEIDEATLNPRERAFLDEARAMNVGDGVGLPLFGPDGRRGQCGLGFREGVRRLDSATLREFWQVCELAHLRFCALVLPTLGRPELSRRETEVLSWVARGKSNAMIGEILGISGATVDAHLRRIYLKLGVFDRISAAVRGIGSGLIHSEI
jgi:LuxR family transcriptional regulator/LuxR family quorum-sensing system transcriptional regulator CciR